MLKAIKFLVALLGLVMLAALALPFVIDVNDYKDDIRKAVHDATGRDLSIEHIELSVFPWVGVTLEQVALQNAQGFAAKDMLRVKSMDVQLELIPLFSQRIEVKRFVLETPQIWLAKHADGQTNWSDLLAKPQKADPASDPKQATTAVAIKDVKGKSAAPNISFNAKLLHLKDGQVTWSDDVYGNISLSAMQLKLHNLQLLEPIGIDFSANVAGNPVNVHADVGPVGDLTALDVQQLPVLLRLQGESFQLKPFAAWLPILDGAAQAQVGDLADVGIGFDLSLEQHADGKLLTSGDIHVQAKHALSASWSLNSKQLKSLHLQSFKLGIDDKHLLELSGEVKNMQRNPKFEFRLETAKVQRLWLNSFVPALQQLYSGNPKPWKSVKLSALIAGDQALLDIRNMQLQLDDDDVQISGNVALGNAPDVQLRLSAN
ncbi:MAG: AsmA family protein, partial [Ghiorsea sp.]